MGRRGEEGRGVEKRREGEGGDRKGRGMILAEEQKEEEEEEEEDDGEEEEYEDEEEKGSILSS